MRPQPPPRNGTTTSVNTPAGTSVSTHCGLCSHREVSRRVGLTLALLAAVASSSLGTVFQANATQADALAEPSDDQKIESQKELPPSLRIVKLLWKTQAKSAATSLEKALDQALTRRQTADLRPHLQAFAPALKEALRDVHDPRWAAAVGALTLAGDKDGLRIIAEAVSATTPNGERIEAPLSPAKRDLLLRTWLHAAPREALVYLHKMLDRESFSAADDSAAWVETLALRGLQYDRAATVEQLLRRWKALPKPMQVGLIEPLTEQAASMKQLVAAIESGTVAKDMLNTNQLVKWTTAGDAEMSTTIARVWGKLRVADDDDRKAVVTRMMSVLSSGKSGNPIAGEQTFKRICAQCHRLHGEGIELGPDITANGRGSFEQLVSNVMDPSLVIGTAFLAKTVLTADGRVLAGLVAAEDEKRLTIKIQGGSLIELDREADIDQIKDSTKSLMPDGLEQQMSEQELVDLFAYLSLTKPLSAPENDTIPGTPEKLIVQ